MKRLIQALIMAGLFGMLTACIAGPSDPLDQIDAADQYYTE